MENKNLSKTLSIEWHSIIKDIVKNIIVVVEAVLIGLMGAFIYQHSVYKPEYTSTATFVVNAKVGNYSSFAGLSVSAEMTKVLSEIFQQPSMRSRAAAYAGKGSFRGSLSASPVEGTNLMQISVTSDDPQNSYEMVKAVLAVYPEISDNVFSNAVLDIIKTPSIPHGPSNSFSRSNESMIVLGTTAASLAIIILLSIFRDTIKTENDFNEKIDAKLLGSIVHEKKKKSFKTRKKKKALLISGSAFTSLKFSEGYHKITAKLEYLNHKNGDKVFAITSVAENEGKSTTASNIALSLASRGKKVLLLDLDEKKPALYKIFEADFKEDSELGDLLSGKISPDKFLFRRYKKSSLYLALNTKAHREYQKWYENNSLKRVLELMKERVDYIIIDTAPLSVDAAVTNIVELVDKTILVVRTDIVHTASINDAVLTIKEVGGEFAGCILNDVYPEFSMFGQSGFDESGYYATKSYGRYGKYGKYGSYGKYSKYGKYGSYGKYSKYGRYGRYASAEDFIDEGAMFETATLSDSNEGGAV